MGQFPVTVRLKEPPPILAVDGLADLVSGFLKAIEVVEIETFFSECLNEVFDDKAISGSNRIQIDSVIPCYIRI